MNLGCIGEEGSLVSYYDRSTFSPPKVSNTSEGRTHKRSFSIDFYTRIYTSVS